MTISEGGPVRSYAVGPPRRILVPLDLSARSRVGLSYAALLAAPFDATLILMTNVNLPEQAVLEEHAARTGCSADEAGPTLLRSVAEEIAPGITSAIVLRQHAFPANGILAVADEEDADLIVVASHGRSGMSRWLLGSVAEKVARVADVPVVIVPTRHDRFDGSIAGL
ncbi:MAG: universal stress protein [Acidimicrobiales bacterium]